jgi:hypothetical protein
MRDDAWELHAVMTSGSDNDSNCASAMVGRTGVAGGCFIDVPLPEPSITASNDERCMRLERPKHWATSL